MKRRQKAESKRQKAANRLPSAFRQPRRVCPTESFAFCLPPPRAVQPELLDLVIEDQDELAANLADLRTVNRWLGGTHSVMRAVAHVVSTFDRPQHPLRFLDVATGSGDVPLALQAWGQRYHIPLQVYGSDLLVEVLAEARAYTKGKLSLLRHDALHLPFADHTLDIVTCAQALHHFDPPAAIALLRELARAAQAVVITDLRRSSFAYHGARALTITQRSAMSRHDGPLSVLRAYTVDEARRLCVEAGLHNAEVRRDGVFRLVIVWRQG